MPNVEAMTEAVKALRVEKEKQKELQNQRTEQRAAIQHSDQRINRMEQQLKVKIPTLSKRSHGEYPEKSI